MSHDLSTFHLGGSSEGILAKISCFFLPLQGFGKDLRTLSLDLKTVFLVLKAEVSLFIFVDGLDLVFVVLTGGFGETVP